MKLTVPAYVLSVCQVLHNAGHDTYIVGGAMRDSLLGRPVHEYDITTAATPDIVHSLFPNYVDTGVAFGTVTVLIKDGDKTNHCEVTTFRTESGYTDSRRPDTILFGKTIEEDLARRDFTINAIAFNPLTKRLVDTYGGLQDLQARRLRAIRDPKERFVEDTLRLFRACRFAAQLDFALEDNTYEAVMALGPCVPFPAIERSHIELTKILDADACDRGFDLAKKAGLLHRVLPDIRDNMLSVLKMSEIDPPIRWARLIGCCEDYKKAIKDLRFSNKEGLWIERLIERQFDPEKARFEIKDLALSGQEIMDMGYTGRAIGNIQHLLQEAVLKEETPNEKQSLLLFLQTKLF